MRAWVFDMDDTLYPREQGLMTLVQARINAYVVEAVGLEPEEARVLQRQFLDEHGTTLAGLMAVLGVVRVTRVRLTAPQRGGWWGGD